MTDSNDNAQERKDATIVSGVMLRRDFVYDKRKAMIAEHGNAAIVTREAMTNFNKEARELYPKDGMYKVQEGVITYLGEY